MGRGITARASLIAVLLALAAAPAAASACSTETVEVRGKAGVARFSVEVADSDAERAQGLMRRERLPSAAGMLFVYERPRRASFWMEQTLIPLDMIFADPAGRVTKVHANAKPLDRTAIDGGEGVQFVLEINGGLAARMGIAEGAILRHPLIAQATAAWPCAAE